MATDEDRDAALESRIWLQAVINHTGLKPSPLAKGAGIHPATLTRALDPEINSVLNERTVRLLCQAYNVPAPSGALTFGLSEPELLPYNAGPAKTAATKPTPDQYRRIVNTRALELAGFIAGDIIDLDMSRTPAANDIVDAQLYSPSSMSAQTVLRLYDPPYLVTRSADPAIDQKPHLVDNERVRIAAIVIKSTRIIHK